MTAPDEPTAAPASQPVSSPPAVSSPVAGNDALSAAGVALAAVENLSLERHPEAFAHFDELLRAALEAPPHVGSG